MRTPWAARACDLNALGTGLGGRLGGCDHAALRRSSCPAAPGPAGGADADGATIPLPRLARDRDPGRGQRHDRPHRGRAEAAATDRQPPHHRALQVSGPRGRGAPLPAGPTRTPRSAHCSRSTASLDCLLHLPLLPDLTQMHKYLPRLAEQLVKRSQEATQTHVCVLFKSSKKKNPHTHISKHSSDRP